MPSLAPTPDSSLRSGALQGAGLGLRRAFTAAVAAAIDQPAAANHRPAAASADPLAPAPAPDLVRQVDFWEIAPENWIGVGGRLGRQLRALTERRPCVAHGLSLSIGAPTPLDRDFIRRLKQFLDQHQILAYSEHLSYCSDHGHLYDLLPIPFTEAAVEHVAARIRQVQDLLERRIALENVSYYAAPAGGGTPLSEQAFLLAVLAEADCDLLLDLNNLFVNSINHRYDPRAFLAALPAERIRYGHVAGHYVEAPDLRVDTHGSAVSDPVWDLLDLAYRHFGPFPTLLERDFNLPPLPQLLGEVAQISAIQQRHGPAHRRVAAASQPRPPNSGNPQTGAYQRPVAANHV
ncbi:MAG: DUF692 domain-containing protein [Chromatiaceae bacterium]|nr:MAG: DUF692 domain-containing protein [Chromatiaceae bacterium]